MAKDVTFIVLQEGKRLDRRELLEGAQGQAMLEMENL